MLPKGLTPIEFDSFGYFDCDSARYIWFAGC
jgi:hypothetical protein